ncbi:MAG TPA: sialate O-acetylesterase [Terriglobia bacterium]|nr:sialate O-acetylesterase [Terriglobia bacterium]
MRNGSRRKRAVACPGANRWKIYGQLLLGVVLAVLMGARTAAADVRLPALIGDNMVLQQGRQVAIWGTADAGEQVTVSMAEQKETATADSDGKWKVEFGPLKQGGPYEMTVAGKNTVTLHNVLVGEVWVCSGQSNMEFTVSSPYAGGVKNADQEVAAAHYPLLRLFIVKKAVAGKPQTDVEGRWVVASPETVGNFSAVGYFFGRELHRTLKFPVGLIDSSWGGTEAEAWTSAPALEADPDLKVVANSWQHSIAEFPHALEQYDTKLRDWERSAEEAEVNGKVAPPLPDGPKDPRSHSWRDAGLWNAMMAPLTPYAIAGAIWYQGESNADFAYQYRRVFTAMIQQWRSSWGEGDFPFLFVQLANFDAGGKFPDAWAVLRESQDKTLALPKTGMAVTIDIGESHNIHPTNKQEVGRRLALAAEGIAYGRKIEYRGPAFKSLRADRGTLRLQFTHAAGGLVVRGQRLMGFDIAGEDQQFLPAEAQIEGSDVVLSSSRVANPVAARYAWANDPKCNLYNKQGLPAPPFRTDDWPVSTQGAVRTETTKLW